MTRSLKMVDGRTDADGRRLDGYTISSPCEPKVSGEIKLFTSAAEIENTSGIDRMWNAASEKFGFIRKGTQCCASVRIPAL